MNTTRIYHVVFKYSSIMFRLIKGCVQVHTRLPVGGGGVCAALVAGEVDERELAVHAVHAGRPHYDLEHRVRPRAVRVGRRLQPQKHYNIWTLIYTLRSF